ncbi:glycerol dehydratase reactivase beta/small subunit family protein [Micropruina sonneratiae]|uniref:glycerol dehydratase reactivase beta/small subunit family protein n=1 Tax=Micropruina sonneratiae TaxID=2986940 RepID=UPI002227DDA3|nr:glycerol dehydratase reactivase beta/small subunit family protein [Micropruina sp. KQZ13P-5]MCW3157268.1 glycerol dehydratase reactivase beta/small subunit family protein [Micropruina sp. KQZ13P-5]
MRPISDAERPRIGLRVNDRLPRDRIAEVLHGIEEEGVPVEVIVDAELNPLQLAHAASLASRLGIGIGISLDWVVTTTEKLPPGRPYLVSVLNQSETTDRAAGANAARLVKRMPLNV